MAESSKKKKGLSTLYVKIEARDAALETIEEASTVFYIVAGLIAVISFIWEPVLLIDAALYGIGGFFLRRFNSRVAAVILLVMSISWAGATLANAVGVNLGGDRNIFLALILLWFSYRAVQATFKL